MSAFFVIITLLLLLIFLMIGIASKFNTARITGLYLIFASVSFMIMLVVLAIFYSEEWKGIFNKGQSERSAFHSGKQYTAPNIKEIPDGKGPETPVDLPSADPSESSPKSPLQSNEESDQSSANIDVPVDKIVDYKVVKGDGLWSIARRSGVTVENLKQWNNLSSDIIYIGQVIKIYGKDITPPPSAPLPDGPAGDSPPSLLLFHGSLHKKQIALTFDAGSDSAGIEILDILKKHNVKATFFLTGKWVESFPVYAKRIVSEGHSIGNHTYSHPDAAKVSTEVFKSDIEKAEKAIKKITGISPRPYFRFPYGSSNEQALKVAGESGYKYSLHWSLDTIDWKQPSAETIVNRIKGGASNGDIILMHIGGIHTPAAVDEAIPLLKDDGYELVTMDQMLN